MKAKLKVNRLSNIELLRIISILLIISFHYVYKSGFTYDTLNYNTFIVKTFTFFGELGVNLFVLITGYFMINGKFKVKKLILIICEVLFYYLLTQIIGISIGAIKTPTSISSKILLFFPTILSKYWFATVYIIIYILSPYLNKFIKSMTKKEFKKFLIIVLFLWCIIPTFFGVFYNSTETILYYSRLIWLIIIYFVGAYIKKYDYDYLNTNKKRILCAVITFAIMLLSIFIIYRFRFRLNHLGLKELSYFWTPNNILMFLLSISIFGLFLNINIKDNKVINTIASTTLGIYLIHDGEICRYVWSHVFKAKEFLSGHYPLSHILLTTLIVFIVGVIIDLLRQLFERKVFNKFVDYIITKLSFIKKKNRLFNR